MKICVCLGLIFGQVEDCKRAFKVADEMCTDETLQIVAGSVTGVLNWSGRAILGYSAVISRGFELNAHGVNHVLNRV